MKFTSSIVLVLAAISHLGATQAVVGKAEGFAAGVTGGGSATLDYPDTIDDLVSLLTDSTARVIVLDRGFDFSTSEGNETGTACQSWGTGPSCQKIIQEDCGDSPSIQGTWFKAPTNPIDVASNKTILGVGDKGVIKGKGLRFRAGVSNIIVQNIAVTDLNPEYVWGGDAISFDESDLIWIDHVTTARTGRQHYVFGFNPNHRITRSNNHIDGESPYSTGCDSHHHYWTFEMVGTDDQITMKGNYITKTSGRSPALSGGTLLHAVNNVWEDNDGHALEGGDKKARGVFEGNAFVNVSTLVADYQGRLFAPADEGTGAGCEEAFGRACVANALDGTSADDFAAFDDTSFFPDFDGLTIASAVSAKEAQASVPESAGMGKLQADTASTAAAQKQVTQASTQAAAPVATSTASGESPAAAAGLWEQCGGRGWSGATSCSEGKCVKQNEWYSQCLQ